MNLIARSDLSCRREGCALIACRPARRFAESEQDRNVDDRPVGVVDHGVRIEHSAAIASGSGAHSRSSSAGNGCIFFCHPGGSCPARSTFSASRAGVAILRRVMAPDDLDVVGGPRRVHHQFRRVGVVAVRDGVLGVLGLFRPSLLLRSDADTAEKKAGNRGRNRSLSFSPFPMGVSSKELAPGALGGNRGATENAVFFARIAGLW